MSTTRHAEPDAPLSQERYMSSPEYSELRGLAGGAVAAKAALQTEPREKALLFFLQALSLREGGLRKVAADFPAMFPERIGTPSMHKFGIKPGTTYNAAQVRVVREEVESRRWRTEEQRLEEIAAHALASIGDHRPKEYGGPFPLKGEYKRESEEVSYRDFLDRTYTEAKAEKVKENQDHAARAEKLPDSYPAAVFVDYCKECVEGELERFITELCIDPSSRSISGTGPWHFRDAAGALHEFKARHEQATRARIAETGIGRHVFRTLARGLRSRKIVVVNGVEGVGKSFNGEAWVEQHLGEARFVRLRGNQTETTFYSAVWVACGLGSPVNRSLPELRSRVDRFLEQTGIMLVIDEGHRLLPQAERIYTQPALMNWLYGLWDIGLPCALLVTPQFASRMDAVERQTDWRSGQFKRRVACWVDLPERLTEADIRAVALKRAPRYSKAMIDELVDCALTARRQIDAMSRAIEAAEFIAEESGRNQVTARDLLAGVEEAQQTDLALTTKLDVERQGNGSKKARRGAKRTPGSSPAAVLQQSRSTPAGDDFPSDESATTTNRLGGLAVADS